jgi:monothiol glutaredoxin
MVFVVALIVLVALAVIVHRTGPARSRMQPARSESRSEKTTRGYPPMSAEDTIKQTVTENDVVLFMKGTKMMPQCGFSSRVAGVLNFMGVEFQDVNVLADEEIRQGIKDYSDWPTIPQLYVKGEFVGGCDIITEMTLSGELDTLFEQNGVSYSKEAADKIREANA